MQPQLSIIIETVAECRQAFDTKQEPESVKDLVHRISDALKLNEEATLRLVKDSRDVPHAFTGSKSIFLLDPARMLPFEAAKRLYAYERMQALQAVEALLIIRKGIHSGQRLANAPDFAAMLNAIIDNNLVRGRNDMT